MSNERKNPREDRLVADTYRTVARERAPDHINEKVLKLAAQAGRRRYSLARAWMRPVAWAATIGLSFAIVLELTRLPQIEPELVGISSSDETAVPDDRANDEDSATERRSDAPAPDSLDDLSNAKRTEPATPAAPASETMRQFAPKDMAVIREAENRARVQAGPDQAGAVAAATVMGDVSEHDPAVVEEVVLEEAAAASNVERFAASRSLAAAAEKKETTFDRSCPDEVRETAEAWYECIKDLRNEGFDDLASSEYEEFERKFPNFVDPDPGR